jgi:hypothetical protein
MNDGQTTEIPGFCPHCKIAFDSGIAVGGSVVLNNVATACPQCRRDVMLPNGTHEFMNGVYAIVGSSGSRADATALVRALSAANRKRATPEEIVSQVKAKAPAFAPLVERYIPRDSATLASWIAATVAILSFAYQLKSGSGPKVTNIYNTTIVSRPAASAPAIPRNTLCPCGSKKKFKKCCGAAVR